MTCTIPLNYASPIKKRVLTSLRITYAVAILAGASVMFFGMGAGFFILPAAIVIGVAAVLSARRLGILHALGANGAAAMSVGVSVFVTQLLDERPAAQTYVDAAQMALAMLAMFGVLGLIGGGVTIGVRWIIRKLIARVLATAAAKRPATA